MKKSSHKDIHNNFFTPPIYHSQVGGVNRELWPICTKCMCFCPAFGRKTLFFNSSFLRMSNFYICKNRSL